MIGRLRGKLLECSPGQVLLDAGGVGYAVQIPLSTFYALSNQSDGETAELYVHTHVREEAHMASYVSTTCSCASQAAYSMAC